MNLNFSSFSFSIYFLFLFPFLEHLGLGLEVIGHTVTSVTSVTSDGISTILIIGLERRE